MVVTTEQPINGRLEMMRSIEELRGISGSPVAALNGVFGMNAAQLEDLAWAIAIQIAQMTQHQTLPEDRDRLGAVLAEVNRIRANAIGGFVRYPGSARAGE